MVAYRDHFPIGDAFGMHEITYTVNEIAQYINY
jgi:hypothetical protein